MSLRELGDGCTRYWLYDVPEAHLHWLLREGYRRMQLREKAASPNRIAIDDPRIKAKTRWRKLVGRLTQEP